MFYTFNHTTTYNDGDQHVCHHDHLPSSSSSIIIIIYSLNVRVVGAPQMISQPLSSIFHSSPPPSGTCRTPSLSIPWCCLPTSSSICLVFFHLSLCISRWFWPDLMNGRHDHTTTVCVFLQWAGGLRVVLLPAGSWHGLPHWWHGLCMRCIESCGSTSFPWLFFFCVCFCFFLFFSFELCCEGPWFTSIHEDGCDKGAHQSYPATERNTPAIPNWFELC